MIIKYPTALYKNALPSEPSDSASVTYTISNEIPPRTRLSFPKVPVGSYGKKRQPSTATKQDKRAVVGDLLFTVSSARRQTSESTTQQYQTGQVLDFNDVSLRSVEPMLVTSATEARHDTNRFDYEKLGISEEEVGIINNESLKTYETLVDELNNLRVARADAESRIASNQKKVNEANRNLDALEIISSNNPTDSDVEALIAKFQKARDDAQTAVNAAIADANDCSAKSSQVLDDLRKVMMVLT